MLTREEWMAYVLRPEEGPLATYIRTIAVGEPCRVELYDGKQVAANVQRYGVRKIRPHHYRGVVLLAGDSAGTGEVRAIETDRDDVRAWLTSEGVPCLRIGPPK